MNGMPMPSTYADRNCSVARALEVVGERWTLLIVRDAFYGIRRFGDFVTQLGIPRAVLTTRLRILVDEGVFARERGDSGAYEYRLTDKGVALWPTLDALMSWGDTFYSPTGVRRLRRHDVDDGLVQADGSCGTCRQPVPVTELRMERGPGFDAAHTTSDPVSVLIDTPRRLLEPIRASTDSEPAAAAARGAAQRRTRSTREHA
jgi:DNA-binding HxlR family transcriptional regulator